MCLRAAGLPIVKEVEAAVLRRRTKAVPARLEYLNET
jgi:hypothetical protein